MILVGSQRSGGIKLAAHLLNDRENDHVTVIELRGFVGRTLRDAFDEAHAISKATKATQYLFSLSLNPPQDADIDVEALRDAANRAETVLGLNGQPRTIVVHEKYGRRHAHVVWSRIDARTLTAINLPFFKTRLATLSRDLFLEHGWELPEGHRTNGWKNPLNFTLAEWQQAQRLGLDPREIKQVFQDAWKRSDNLSSFRHALEEHGYFLAKGDRRGFVALDIHGEPFAVARWIGLKTKDVAQRLGDADALPGVEDVRQSIKARMIDTLKALSSDSRKAQENARAPLQVERAAMTAQHRTERKRLQDGQDARWRREAAARAARLRSGMRRVWDILTGQAAVIRRENERESYEALLRDRAQQEELFKAQSRERRELQARIDALAKRQLQERREVARRIGALLRQQDPSQNQTRIFRRNGRDRGPSLTR